jgi:dihydroflavonol-4-reductase
VRALVTGAAGFIGAHVVRALLEEGHEVRALHLPTEDVRNLEGLDVERFAGDVTDEARMREAARGRDVVFHLAAVYALWERTPGTMRRVNVGGTRAVLAAARREGVRRVVHTSSIARFGGQGFARGGGARRATEESPFALGPTGDVYSCTKQEAHEVALEAARDMDVVIVAPTGPIGPGDVAPTPTGRILLACMALPVVVVARTVVNFADVRDIARGHVLAAERGRRGESYLLGARDMTLAELARAALAVIGARRVVVEAPYRAARVVARGAQAWADRVSRRPPLLTPASVAIAELGLAADCAKAVRELGMPQTPIEVALRDALAWFSRHGYTRARLHDA